MEGLVILSAAMHDPMFRAASNPLCCTFMGTPQQRIVFGHHILAEVPSILDEMADLPADLPTIFACVARYREELAASNLYERLWDKADEDTQRQYSKTMFVNLFAAASRSVAAQANEHSEQLSAVPLDALGERFECFCRALGLNEDNRARVREGTLTIEQLLESQPSVIIGFGSTTPQREC